MLTHAAISLLRAASAQPELGFDPAALEHDLVRLVEAFSTHWWRRAIRARRVPGAGAAEGRRPGSLRRLPDL